MGLNLLLTLATIYTVELSIVGKLEGSFVEKDLGVLVACSPWHTLLNILK